MSHARHPFLILVTEDGAERYNRRQETPFCEVTVEPHGLRHAWRVLRGKYRVRFEVKPNLQHTRRGKAT